MGGTAEPVDYRALLKRAILSVEELQARIEALESARREPIAVVGLACRFPGGANDGESYWRLLSQGYDAVREVPPDRWDAGAYLDPDDPSKSYGQYGAFLEDVDGFDAAFFGISPREAKAMDPQQRLLLEVAWEALEDAGLPPLGLAGSCTGVFVGLVGNDYAQLQLADPARIDTYTGTGTSNSVAAGRLSYLLDLQGPSLAVDTACSSALVAVHLACQSLRASECNLALAGAIHLLLSPLSAGVIPGKMQLLAADGRCKTFDARADGIGVGEGCGVVVLKRLSDARAAGDRILALIRGSAMNQDGHSNGLTAPSGLAQEAVIRQALVNAEVAAEHISYVEAHGTGTPLGDPIEVEALSAALGRRDAQGAPCLLGSVKTNLGHLGGAAGMAGLIKVVLSLVHGEVPPSLHFTALNPNIVLDRTGFVIPTELRSWPPDSRPRYAGVSAFGWAGTNAHMILEQAPAAAVLSEQAAPRGACLLPLSARSPEALRCQAHAHREYLATTGAALPVHDVCYTAGVRRSHYEYRLAVVGASVDEMVVRLGRFLAGESQNSSIPSGRAAAHRPGLAFVFSGQGTQWAGMGAALLETEPIFRTALEECDASLRRHAHWSVIDELGASPERSRLDLTEIAQPAIVALQLALVALWRSWGIMPEAVAGHSVGEIAAACVAGALTLDEAMLVAYQRGRVMAPTAGHGRMAAVELPSAEAAEVLAGYGDRLALAAVNSPTSTVLSGDPTVLGEVLETLKQRGVECRMLRMNYAFHSPQMARCRDELLGALGGLTPCATALPMVSTVSGLTVAGPELGAAYWARNVREPVQFAPAIDSLQRQGYGTFVEISAHPVLARPISQCLETSGGGGLVLPSLRRGGGEQVTLLGTLGALYCQGFPVDWSALSSPRGHLVRLPTYPWQRQRFWLEGAAHASGVSPATPRTTGGHPLLGSRLRTPLHLYEQQVAVDAPAYLSDHRIHGRAVFPASAYLEMALSAAAELLGAFPLCVQDAEIREALVLPEEGGCTVQLLLTPVGPGEASFQVFSIPSTAKPDLPWPLHMSGRVLRTEKGAPASDMPALEAAQAQCTDEQAIDAHYTRLRERALAYGPAFQGLRRLWRSGSQALGLVELPEGLCAEGDAAYRLHPALLDACLQPLASVLTAAEQGSLSISLPHLTYLPVGLERLQVYARPGNRVWSHVSLRPPSTPGGDTLLSDVRVFDEAGGLVAEVSGLRLRQADRRAPPAQEYDLDNWLYALEWHSLPREQHRPVQSQQDTPMDAGSGPGRWLILADSSGAGAALAEHLRRHGQIPVLVEPQPVPEGADDRPGGTYPWMLQEWQQLLASQTSQEQPLRGVVHLWGLDAGAPQGVTIASLQRDQALACGSALHLIQALVTRTAMSGQGAERPRLWFVTRGAQALPAAGESSEAPVPAQATLWGLGRVIALEHPDLWGGLVDLDPDVEVGETVAMLAAEVLEPSAEDNLAYRGGQRFAARLAHSAMTASRSPAHLLRSDATYLVTGGMGGLGLQVARWLAVQGARHLVLVGRRGPSPAAGAVLDDLRQAGVRVVIAQADVAREQELARALDEVRASLPPLHGVVHAAGVVDDGVLLRQDWSRFAAVLAPKVEGAWNLHALTIGAPLDFFVVFSSAVSLLGSAGQASYAAANAFLDSLAHLRRAAGLPALSINWGPWADAGMAAAGGARSASRLALLGMGSIDPQEGVRALGRVLSTAEAEVGVFSVDWRAFAGRFPEGGAPPLLSVLVHRARGEVGGKPASAGESELLQRLQAAGPTARSDLLLEHLQEEVARVLGLDATRPVDPDQGLFDLGMDSLMAVELKNRLQARLGKPLPGTLLFDYPTLAALAAYLLDQVPAGITSAHDGAPSADDRAALLAEIEGLSEEDVDALLASLSETLLEGHTA